MGNNGNWNSWVTIIFVGIGYFLSGCSVKWIRFLCEVVFGALSFALHMNMNYEVTIYYIILACYLKRGRHV